MGQIFKLIKDWTLLFAIIIGILGGKWWNILATSFTGLLPSLIFIMLILSLSKIEDSKPQDIKLHVIFILLQTTIGLASYFIFKSYDTFLAQGLIMIIFGAAANASPLRADCSKRLSGFSIFEAGFPEDFFALLFG